jgi:hypothetical protein
MATQQLYQFGHVVAIEHLVPSLSYLRIVVWQQKLVKPFLRIYLSGILPGYPYEEG